MQTHPTRTGRDFVYSPPPTPLEIIHQDTDLLIVNKPCGLLSVPGKTEALNDSVEYRAIAHHPDARIVHRLDMATSGLMVLALNHDALRHLGLQFERRHIGKTYRAQVSGRVLGETGHINLPLRCDWPNRPLQMVDFEAGKSAQTDWEVLDRTEQFSNVRLHPRTGRSHQLRVHMLSIGHAILGDRLYADDDVFNAAPRLMLHAETLSLRHPTGGEPHTFTSPSPF